MLAEPAAPAAPVTAEQRIEQQLAAAPSPLTASAIRKLCRIRNSTLQTALAVLVASGRIRKDGSGYSIER